ncbi:MAG: rRNA maturation RNase YbeY [Rhodospirillaceae bacterium]|nr:MAG: rRNA maturation RNase YbeY [Rhodospirillaceae bacterium]
MIDVSQPTAAWRKALPRSAHLARTMAAAALRYGFKTAPVRDNHTRKSGPRTGLEISVVLTGNAVVRRLNRVYRGKDKPTNVLSFPADAPPTRATARFLINGRPAPTAPWLLGDVVIAYGVAAAEARAEGKTLAAHLAHLVLHGVLHLLGYDHEDDRDVVVMERLEREIMARMGFDDPYAIPAPARKSRVPRRRALAATPRTSRAASKQRP